MTTPTHAVLLAAGAGTRAWPLTATRPKPALPVGDETLMGRLLRQLREAGIDTVTVVAPETKGPVAEHARTVGQRLELKVHLAVQEDPRGTGHALQQADVSAGSVLVLNGDLMLPEGALDRIAQASGNAIGAARVEDVSPYGALVRNGERLTAIEEKPTRPEPGLVNAGVYRLDSTVRSHLEALEESPRGEIELTDAIEAAISAHQPVSVVTFEDWLDVGWPWDLLAANRMALSSMEPELAGDVEEKANLHGPIRVEEGATVRSGAVLEGPVLVREGATVGPNAYVRGASTIGPGAKVGHASEVKNSVLFPDAKVPHVSYVGDSVLGEDVNLGAGTQVANLRHDGANVQTKTQRGAIDTSRRKLGVVLGDGVKTGINATLNVGVMLGPGQTVKPGERVYESRLPDG